MVIIITIGKGRCTEWILLILHRLDPLPLYLHKTFARTMRRLANLSVLKTRKMSPHGGQIYYQLAGVQEASVLLFRTDIVTSYELTLSLIGFWSSGPNQGNAITNELFRSCIYVPRHQRR